MARVKRYIDTNVLDEAKKRLHHIYDLFDSVVVAFSGGKDSLAVLHLTHEVAQERGDGRVRAIFRDEELIPDQVVDFVDHYRTTMPWLDLTWYAVPLESHKFVLGRTARYVQWDPNRPHLRPAPAHAVTLDTLGLPADTVLSQYDMDAVTAQAFPGRVAILTGIRADESLIRLRSCVNKLSENYINASSTPKASLCKPIFDWHENDVFRYFYDRGIRYCPLYDAQIWSGTQLRVSTPLHAESAKRIGLLRSTSPTFYGQVMDLFPEMLVQERYYAELDRAAVTANYATDLDGVARWVEENIPDDHQRALACKELRRIRIACQTSPEAYPPDYVLKAMMTGAYKRELLPISRNEQARRRRKATQ